MLSLIPLDIILFNIIRYLDTRDSIKLSEVLGIHNIIKYCENICLNTTIMYGGKLDIFNKNIISLDIKFSRNILSSTGGYQLINFKNLKNLSLNKCCDLEDFCIKDLHNLEILNLPRCTKITDLGICNLNKMRELNLSLSCKITDKGIENMYNIEILKLFFNRNITENGLRNMKKIHTLYLPYCHDISNNMYTS